MSNPKKDKPRISFSADHTRITPYSEAELRTLEPGEVGALVRRFYDNSPLYDQLLNPHWRHIVAKIGIRRDGSYLDDELLLPGFNFLRHLQKMENAWESYMLRKGTSKATGSFNLRLREHPCFDDYIARQRDLGKDSQVDPLHLDRDQALDGLRWCNTLAEIRRSKHLSSYLAKPGSLDPARCSYLGLRGIVSDLARIDASAQLIVSIQQHEGWQNVLSFDAQQHRITPGKSLEGLDLKGLRALLTSLQKMRETGVSIDDKGDLFGAPINK